MIHVAVGILINSQGEVLIAQRPAHKYAPGLWEFPGGKVEPQENVYDALCREFLEEIGIGIISAKSWFQFKHDYSDRVVLLDNWLIKKFSGEPRGAEGQLIRWVSLGDLNQYQFPEGNREIIKRLSSSPNPLIHEKARGGEG